MARHPQYDLFTKILAQPGISKLGVTRSILEAMPPEAIQDMARQLGLVPVQGPAAARPILPASGVVASPHPPTPAPRSSRPPEPAREPIPARPLPAGTHVRGPITVPPKKRPAPTPEPERPPPTETTWDEKPIPLAPVGSKVYDVRWHPEVGYHLPIGEHLREPEEESEQPGWFAREWERFKHDMSPLTGAMRGAGNFVRRQLDLPERMERDGQPLRYRSVYQPHPALAPDHRALLNATYAKFRLHPSRKTLAAHGEAIDRAVNNLGADGSPGTMRQQQHLIRQLHRSKAFLGSLALAMKLGREGEPVRYMGEPFAASQPRTRPLPEWVPREEEGREATTGFVPVKSSWIAGLKLTDDGRGVSMTVKKGGKTYPYPGFGLKEFRAWAKAMSPGGWWWRNIGRPMQGQPHQDVHRPEPPAGKPKGKRVMASRDGRPVLYAAHPDIHAFLRAVAENPEDEAPRGAFADWLDEHEMPATAEIMRRHNRLREDPEPRRQIGHFYSPEWYEPGMGNEKRVWVSAIGRGKESVFDPEDSRGHPHVNFQFHPAGLSIGDEPILHHDETDPRKALALSRELGLKPISARGEGHRDTPEEMVRDVFGVDPAKLRRPGKPRRYADEHPFRGWIGPAGERIPLAEHGMHTEFALKHLGLPEDSNANVGYDAVNKLSANGWLRVSDWNRKGSINVERAKLSDPHTKKNLLEYLGELKPHHRVWIAPLGDSNAFSEWMSPDEAIRHVSEYEPRMGAGERYARRYAAEPVGDFAQALRTLASPNVQSFADAVRQSYQQAGVQGEAVPIIHDTDRSSRVSILGLLRGQTDPRKTLYAAAWHGMMSKSPAVDAFIAGDGPDSLLSVAMPGSAGDARAVLDKIGVSPRLIRPDQNGNEVIIHDRGRKLADRIAGLGLPIRELTGKSVRLNGMEDYRAVTREFENKTPDQPERLSRKKYARNSQDENAFRRAIHAAPHDDAPKLVYADWLQDHGEDALAHVIRQHVKEGAKVLPQQHRIRSIVTQPRGSWRWQDAYAVRSYTPTKGPRGTWYYRWTGTPVDKSSAPQLVRWGYPDPRFGANFGDPATGAIRPHSFEEGEPKPYPEGLTIGRVHNTPVPEHIAHDLELGRKLYGDPI